MWRYRIGVVVIFLNLLVGIYSISVSFGYVNKVLLHCCVADKKMHFSVREFCYKKRNLLKLSCTEFYCRQISAKFSLKLPLCITNLGRLIQTNLLLFLVRVSEDLFRREKVQINKLT